MGVLRVYEKKKKKKRAQTVTLENKLKELEQNPDCTFDCNYLDHKNKFEQIYEQKANGVNIRIKCEWYEFGENWRAISLLNIDTKLISEVLVERLKKLFLL